MTKFRVYGSAFRGLGLMTMMKNKSVITMIMTSQAQARSAEHEECRECEWD